MIEEVWKNIEDFEGLYKISNLGNVKSLEKSQIMPNNKGLKISKERILKTHKNNKGYFYITLSKNGKSTRFLIHRLVALHFIENPLNLPCVCHIDNNQLNNSYLNLQWGTVQDNMNMKVLSNRQHKGEQISKKLKETDVVYIRKNYNKKTMNQKTLANKFNVSSSVISEILNYKTWKHI